MSWGDRWRRLSGQPVEHDLTPYRARLAAIEERWTGLHGLSDGELSTRARGLRADPEAVEVFALVAEAARRSLGLELHPSQLVAGLVMADGKLAEMATGEGKTLAAVAPVAHAALAGRGAHILTFNDYLAQRDAAWMGPVYRTLGLEVAAVGEGQPTADRRRAYAADVTYLTAREAGFDHLRDGLALTTADQVQRPPFFALIDEADSILIDEARVPLVVAGHGDRPDHRAAALAGLAAGLEPGRDFSSDDQRRAVFLTDEGGARVEAELALANLYEAEHRDLHADLLNAIHARHLLTRDVDYIVRHGAVELVDDFTGRVAERRQWPDGLQAAVEAKEGLAPRDGGRILASVTLQHLVTTYPRLAAMTATAAPAARELDEIYGLTTVVIPTHQPCRRRDLDDLVFAHRGAKRRAIVAEIRRRHRLGQPVLVGTASVAESEELAAELVGEGLEVAVLNARNDRLEAEIVASAGAPRAITISTNMAGRGTDIRLGGVDEAGREAVTAAGGLHVVATNRHESRRIDLQLRGRAARQGDPGSSQLILSLEDPLVVTTGVAEAVGRRHRAAGDEAIADPRVAAEIRRAQRIVEGTNGDIRRRLWEGSQVLESQRRLVAERRQAILAAEPELHLLAELDPARLEALVAAVGEAEAAAVEQRLTLLALDRCWSDHLALARDLRDRIHVVGFVGKEPLAEYSRELGQAFTELEGLVDAEVEAAFATLPFTAAGVDWEHAGLCGPSATWTYLINDEPFGDASLRRLANRSTLATAAAIAAGPFLFLWGLALHWRRWTKRRQG